MKVIVNTHYYIPKGSCSSPRGLPAVVFTNFINFKSSALASNNPQ
jgi:hypothetical protein